MTLNQLTSLLKEATQEYLRHGTNEEEVRYYATLIARKEYTR